MSGIRGHECETLGLFQAYGGGCRPKFDARGDISGCDSDNEIMLLMTNCPFCGEVLPAAKLNEWQIEDLKEALTEARREVKRS